MRKKSSIVKTSLNVSTHLNHRTAALSLCCMPVRDMSWLSCFLAYGLSIESMELVLGPLSLPTVGTIFAGCSQRTNSLSSVKLECSE